jgi:hypothetical protein
MSRYYGNFRPGQTVRMRFNTVSGSPPVPTTLSNGSLLVSKDGSDILVSGGITFTVNKDLVVGRHEVSIDTSVDSGNFTGGSDYAVRLAGSSNVGGTSILGIYVGEFSLSNRAVAVNTAGKVQSIVNAADVVGYLPANLIQVLGNPASLSNMLVLKKNQSFNHFPFHMVLSSDHISPAEDVTVTAQRSKDGSPVWQPCDNPPVEVGHGTFTINFTANDLNANQVTLFLTAPGCDNRILYLFPS